MNPTRRLSSPTEPASNRALKIAGIIFLVSVALCGLVGSCLLIVTFFVPLGGH